MKTLLHVNYLEGKGRLQEFLDLALKVGHINITEVMCRLKDHLRSGMFAVEFPNTGDGICAAFKDM